MPPDDQEPRKLDDLPNDSSGPPTVEAMHAALVSTLGELGVPHDLIDSEIVAFRRELTRETDRGAALFAAAHLDERLKMLLHAYFVQDDNVSVPLFKGSGAFATLSSRIDVAYLLGLIPASVHRDLHLVRKIRNDFAHLTAPIGFTEPSVASRCRELARVPLDGSPRRRFVQAVMSCAGQIDGTVRLMKEGRRTRCVNAIETPSTRVDSLMKVLDDVCDRLEKQPSDTSAPSDDQSPSELDQSELQPLEPLKSDGTT